MRDSAHFRSVPASIITGFFAALILASRAFAQAPPPLPNSDHVVTSVQKWDEVQDLLTQVLSGWYRMPGAEVKDSRGRTILDDIEDYMLAQDVSKQLDNLREQARAHESDAEATERLVAQAQPLLESELSKFAVISNYWMMHEAMVYHEQLLEPLLETATDADRETVRAHIRETHEYMVTLLQEGIEESTDQAKGATVARILKAKMDALGFFNERRVALAAHAGGANRAPSRSRNRHVPCPPPATTTSGNKDPRIAPDNTPPESLYPDRAKRMGVEGPVVLRVRVSEAGCMESADVVGSAGDADLDESALAWAENASYLPAVKDGKAAAGSFLFKVKFEIVD